MAIKLDVHLESITFINDANELDKNGQRNAAMDLIFDRIDELMRKEQFSSIDSILRKVCISDQTGDVLLGLLTASLPARGDLPFRAEFCREVKSVLTARGEFEDGLLIGLE